MLASEQHLGELSFGFLQRKWQRKKNELMGVSAKTCLGTGTCMIFLCHSVDLNKVVRLITLL